MITVAKALDSLKANGFISQWWMKQYNEGELTWRSPMVESAEVSVSDETYGTESHLYFTAINRPLAIAMAKVIREAGGKPNFSWCPDNPCAFQLNVSRFHGWHWWE